MKRSQRSFIITVIGFIGVILISFILWKLYKEYSFKTYKDTDGGFSIKYPADWTVQLNVGGAAAIFVSPLENDLDTFREGINIVIQDISNNPVTLQQYSNVAIDQVRAVFGQDFELIDSGYQFISGLPGHKIVFLGKGADFEVKYKIMWTMYGTKVYQVTYTAIPSSYEKFIKKVNIMMASFKLLG